MKHNFLEIKIIDALVERPLGEFFRVLENAGYSQHFHPHPFTIEEAKKRACYSGKDLYCVLVANEQIFGYGMLRGWDEGFDIPSLGIAIHPEFRGRGLGKLLMHFLHAAAQLKMAPKVRLKVYASNLAAISLYQHLGYQFEGEETGQKIGYLSL